MPRSRARRCRRRRPWRASRALANGSQLAGSHTPRAPTCRKHARRWRASAAIITIDPSARWFKAGRLSLLAERQLANYFISNTTGAPSTHSASPRRSAWVTRRSAWVSRHFCLNSCHSIGVSRSAAARPPACVRVRVCAGRKSVERGCVRVRVCAGRKSVEHGRAYEVHPGRDSARSCWRFPGSNLQQPCWG